MKALISSTTTSTVFTVILMRSHTVCSLPRGFLATLYIMLLLSKHFMSFVPQLLFLSTLSRPRISHIQQMDPHVWFGTDSTFIQSLDSRLWIRSRNTLLVRLSLFLLPELNKLILPCKVNVLTSTLQRCICIKIR